MGRATRGMAGVMLGAGIVATGYVALAAYVYVAQRSFLYFPVPAANASARSVTVTSHGESLRVWTAGEGSHAVVYFGGNAEDVSVNVGPLAQAVPGSTVYLESYRGYGGSSGSPTEEALRADAQAVYDSVHESRPRISAIGRSLGSGVAAYLATVRPIDRLVLVTPYDSILNMAKSRFSYLPVGLLLKDRFDTAALVAAIKVRTLILLAEHDATIPRERSMALIERFPPGQVQVEVIAGATHNSIESFPRYNALVGKFLQEE